GLAQDVADALVRGGQRLGLRQQRELGDRLQPPIEIGQRQPTHSLWEPPWRRACPRSRRKRRTYSLELLRRHALLGVVVAQAIEDELAHFGDVGTGGFERGVEVEVDAGLHQRARQRQRVAAQRERVLVAGRLEPGTEAAGQR